MKYEMDVIKHQRVNQFSYDNGEKTVVIPSLPSYGSFRGGTLEIIRDDEIFSTSAIRAEDGKGIKTLFTGLFEEFNDKGGNDTARLIAERFAVGDRIVLTTPNTTPDQFFEIFLKKSATLRTTQVSNIPQSGPTP